MRHPGGGFLRSVGVDLTGADPGGYPFDLPVVGGLAAHGDLALDPGVTFLVGENGTGKSTLVEAIGRALSCNAEGGSRSFRFATRPTESTLGDHLRIVRSPRKPRDTFFLRAESFYNVATEIEALAGAGPAGFLRSYGGRSPHERSHGESFLDLATFRFRAHGLYLLDEPEAALSVRGCMALITRLHDLVAAGCQFVVATHSPVLLALPGATIVQIGADGGLATVGYPDAEPVALTRRFLADPDRYLRDLLD